MENLKSEFLLTLFDELSDGICIYDQRKKDFINISPKLFKALKIPPTQSLFKELPLAEFLDLFLEKELLSELILKKSSKKIILTSNSSDKLAFSIRPLGPTRKFENLQVLSFKDVSTIEQKTPQAPVNNNDLEKFAYIISHDLQGPIRRISSYSEIIRNSLDIKNDFAHKYLEKIELICEESSEMILSLLNLCKINSDDFTRKKIEVDKLLQMSLLPFEGSIDRDEFDLSTSIEDKLYIYANQHHVRDVLFNIINNAIKFKKPDSRSEIEIHVSRYKENLILFKIRDKGIGIKDSSNIFDFYTRKSSKNDGYGIGLGTCQKIIHANGGNIWCESQLDIGSTFYFTVPAEKKSGQ